MSDHEDNSQSSQRGYGHVIPELDDHRHQSSSMPRLDRPRRGTVDTLYGSRRLDVEPGHSSTDIRVRDFEEAVIDGDADIGPLSPRSRRPTVESIQDHLRGLSPPNSVKAFAEARRRERNFSVSSGRAEEPERDRLHRTFSGQSRHSSQRSPRSPHSRPGTVTNKSDGASIATNKSAEDDVCFPVPDEHRRDRLHIDFDYLQNWINAETAARRESLEVQQAPQVFQSLGPTAAQQGDTIPMVTVDGDFIDVPSGESTVDEKEHGNETATADAAGETSPKVERQRFSFFSTTWEATIHAPDFGDLVMPGEDLRNLFSIPRDEDGVWWLDMHQPTEDEIRVICKAFGVHPLTIEDITTQEAREKIELFPSYYFASFRSFNVVQEEDGPDYEPHNIYVVVFREGTLSFSFKPNIHASQVRKRITMLKDYVALSSDWICYALIDHIVDSFAPAIHRIELVTEGIEDSVFIARSDDMQTFLRRIGAVRKNTMGLMRILGGKADVLRGFTKRCNENYKVTPRMDIGMYLGDIQDHVITMMTNLTHFEKILSRAHSNYLAQLTIDNISQGAKTNAGLTKITLLASFIVPLNVITGLFGMNVHVPGQDVENLVGFGTICGVLFLVVIILVACARRARLI